MDYLFVCNTGSDDISKINPIDLKEESRICLDGGEARVGPHGICSWNGNVITANSYNSSISIIDSLKCKLIENCYIGGHCNDVAVLNNDLFITCAECNNIVIFDLDSKRITEEIPGGNMPHSIQINREKDIAIITNMEDDSLTVIDCSTREIVKTISVGSFPTKAIFSSDSKYIFVCESHIGSDCDGFINIISMDNFSSICRIKAGKCPLDIFCEGDMCYLSNFTEGFISFMYLKDLEIVKRVYIGGMPRGLLRRGKYLYIGNNYTNKIVKYDIFRDTKEVISIGMEPTAMTLV